MKAPAEDQIRRGLFNMKNFQVKQNILAEDKKLAYSNIIKSYDRFIILG